MMASESAPPRRSPYVGLLPFRPEDAEFFFGRQAETEILHLNTMSASSTLIYGPSGVGKSSIINAGLLPALQQRDDVLVVPFREWSRTPLASIKSAIVSVAASRVPELECDPSLPLGKILVQVADALADSLDDPDELVQRPGRVVIIFDQFDEYIINYTLESETECELIGAFGRPHPSLAVLLSIREDWLARLDRFRNIFPRLFDNVIRVEPLNDDGAQKAIHGPLERYAVRYPDDGPRSAQSELALAVVAQVRRRHLGSADPLIAQTAEGDDSVDTAFLQVLLQRLWVEERAAGSDTLRLATLERLGDASRILDDHLATVFDRLSPAEQRQAVEVFDRLVTPSETKVAQSAGDLAAYLDADEEAVEAILEGLAAPDARILRSFAPRDRPDSKRYELYHDLLARPVRSWLVGRRVEGQVDAFLKTRLDWADGEAKAEAEATRRILEQLFAAPAAPNVLSESTRLPRATVERLCHSLAAARVIRLDGEIPPRWNFRPGRGYRKELFEIPYAQLLTLREAHQVLVALLATTLVMLVTAGGLAFHLLIQPPVESWEGFRVQVIEATFLLFSAGWLGPALRILFRWRRSAATGLVTREMRARLPKVPLWSAGISSGAFGLVCCVVAFVSEDVSFPDGSVVLMLAGLATTYGFLFASLDSIKIKLGRMATLLRGQRF